MWGHSEWYVLSGGGDNRLIHGVHHEGYLTSWNPGAATQWSSFPFSFDTWQHLAMVSDMTNNEQRFYINGQEVTGGFPAPFWPDGDLVATSVYPGALLVGQEQDCHGGCFEYYQRLIGPIDDLRFYERVLTDDEIATLAGQ